MDDILLAEQLRDFRRRLHCHPELSGQEYQTAALLAEQLAKCRPQQLLEGVGGQGLIAIFDAGEPGPSVLLRADIDALPITETNTFEHRSCQAGVAHKCGHDGHATILLGVARRLSLTPPVRGKVCLLFQPAEETGEGARAVIDDPRVAGINPDLVFALHNLPGYPLGQVVVRSGAFTAAVTSAAISLQGKTCHAAEPEHGINPAGAIAELLQCAAELANNDPTQKLFSLVTPVHMRMGELAYGTAAGQGEVHFTLRSWEQKTMLAMQQRLQRLLTEIAQRHRLTWQLRWVESFSATSNDHDATLLVRDCAQGLGLSLCVAEQPFKWGEDFGLFTQRFRGAMFGIGAGTDSPALHNADYDFPDTITMDAVRLLFAITQRALDTTL